MKITRENLADRQVALIMEFDSQEIEPALDKTYRKLINRVNIPGFRPGKAPRRIFESFVGREALVQEAAQDLMPDAVKEAVSTEGLETAELNDMEIESTDPLRVRVLLDLDSLVELGEYGDVRVGRDEVNVTDQQIEDVIRDLRGREGTWHELEEPRAAQYYDRVTVDMETYTIDGPVANMTGEDIVFQLTERTGPGWPKEIDSSIVGMSVDEEKDFAFTFPEGYTDEEMRGKEATAHVKLKKIEEQTLPEIDEEFIGRASNGDLKTEEELRERIRNNMQVREENDAKTRQVNAAIAELVSRSNIEVSKSAIEHEVEHAYEHLQEDLRERRITPSRYFSYFGLTEADWRATEREKAVPRLKEVLVLRDFAQREGITVEPGDVEAEIETQLAGLGEAGQQESIRELYNSDEQKRQIENRVFERKLTDRLLDIVEGRREAAPASSEATAEDTEEAAPTATAEDEEAPTAEAYTPTEISGATPATEQEPSALEEAGGAAEVLGNGEEAAEEESEAR